MTRPQENKTQSKTTERSESESSGQKDTFGLIIVVLGVTLFLASMIKLPMCSIGTCSEGLAIWLIMLISSFPIMWLGMKIADDEI